MILPKISGRFTFVGQSQRECPRWLFQGTTTKKETPTNLNLFWKWYRRMCMGKSVFKWRTIAKYSHHISTELTFIDETSKKKKTPMPLSTRRRSGEGQWVSKETRRYCKVGIWNKKSVRQIIQYMLQHKTTHGKRCKPIWNNGGEAIIMLILYYIIQLLNLHLIVGTSWTTFVIYIKKTKNDNTTTTATTINAASKLKQQAKVDAASAKQCPTRHINQFYSDNNDNIITFEHINSHGIYPHDEFIELTNAMGILNTTDAGVYSLVETR